MSLYILRWNPNISSYKIEYHLDVVEHIKNKKMPSDFNWSIREPESLKKNDVFILQQVGTDNDGIAMIGKFKDKCYEGDNWRQDGSKLYYADMWIMEAFDCNTENPLPAKRYEKLFPEIKWHGGHSGVLVQDDELSDKLLESIQKDMIKAGRWHKDSLCNFIDCDFYQEAPYLDNKRPSAEELADGKILISLKEKFLEKNSEQNFTQLVCCLHDSVVRVPVTVDFSAEEKNKMQEDFSKGISKVEIGRDFKFCPKLLKNDKGEYAFAVFSNKAEIGDNYKDFDCYFIELSFLECVELAKGMGDCSVLVLDAFTKSFVITMELADIISQIKYQDTSDEDEEKE